MKKAILFPGQGSQHVGMAQELYQNSKRARELMDHANQILGDELLDIMFQGPQEVLKQTKWTQPAVFVHSYALWETHQPKADVLAGHSLGEITALAASGVIDFENALHIVVTRANGMQQAGENSEGTMSAVVGLTDEQVLALCEKATSETNETVIAANFNSPGQVVISGAPLAVEKASILAKEMGCRLVKLLEVSGAFHSPLMLAARGPLEKAIKEANFADAKIPVYCNVTAEPETNAEKLASNLIEQLTSSVRWTQTLQQMNADGIESFLEVGPGKALQGLCKRTLEGVEYSGIES